MNINERGFAHIFLSIAFGVIALGAVGYAIKVHHDATKKVVAVSSTPSALATPTGASSTFTLPELGVSMTLPAGLSDLTYAPSIGTDGKVFGYGITSAKMLSIDPGCLAKNQAIGELAIVDGNGATAAADVKKMPDGKYLYLTEPDGYCFASRAILDNKTTLTTDGDIQINQTALLRAAVQTGVYTK